jgi:Right handed beta helix region
MRLFSRLALLLSATLLFASTAQAQSSPPQLFRAYVASDGSDANPCTVQAPCRLLPAALAAVKDGGEVWIMDSANFNTAPVNITKSVSILAIPGALGSIVGSGGDAILINAPGAKVALRNLKILNFSGGQNGIHMTNGASLKVEGCEIAGFAATNLSAGIKVYTPAKVTIVDTIVRDNSYGVWFDNGSTGDVARTTAVDNAQTGILAGPTVASTVTVTVTDTVASNNTFSGFVATVFIGGGIASMVISRSTAAHNVGGDGFAVTAGGAVMVVSGSVASHNGYVGFNNSGGTFRSLGDNTVFDNTTADTFGTITLVAPK